METTFEQLEQKKLNDSRKTIDVYIIQGSYGFGWGDLTSEISWKEARQRLKEYRENEPGTPHRIKAKRVKKEKYISGDF